MIDGEFERDAMLCRLENALESSQFYELMQEYRHVPLTPQKAVVEAFEAVKQFIRNEV